MTAHRADQILDRVAELIAARVNPDGVKVFTHRRLSLAQDQDELPAISVDFGEDSPVEQNTQFIDSILSVEITGIVSDYDETALRRELLRLRSEAHITLMADETLGLSFVVNTTYGGAVPPEIGADESERLTGALTAPWLVYYRMDRDDPTS